MTNPVTIPNESANYNSVAHVTFINHRLSVELSFNLNPQVLRPRQRDVKIRSQSNISRASVGTADFDLRSVACHIHGDHSEQYFQRRTAVEHSSALHPLGQDPKYPPSSFRTHDRRSSTIAKSVPLCVVSYQCQCNPIPRYCIVYANVATTPQSTSERVGEVGW